MIAAAPKKKHNGLRREQTLTYAAFILPGFAIYCVFLIFPILLGIYYSLMDWNGISPHYDFVGLKNFQSLLTDKKFRAALVFNLRYTVMLVIGIVVISVILALLPNRQFRGRSFFRTLYFLPAVLSMLTVILVFKQIFFHVLPAVGKALGIAALSTNILASKQLAICGLLFVHLWQSVVLPTLLFLAGLQTTSGELYEAAAIDGANAWHQFKSITVAYLILFPIYITLATTFKTASESSVSFFTLPKSLYLGNYRFVLHDQKLYYAYGNTLLIIDVSLVGELILLPSWATRCRGPWA